MTSALEEALIGRIQQLEKTQWIPSQAIVDFQFQQLGLLVPFCAAHSSDFAERLKQSNLTPHQCSTPEGFFQLPLLSRRDLQERGEAIYCKASPQNHGTVHYAQSSGSTGTPVKVRRTGLNKLNWSASNILDHLWHGRDVSQRLCAIRPTIPAYTLQDNWGPPTNILFKTGSSLGLPVTADVGQLAEWIADFQPNNLLLFPSLLKALAEHCFKYSISFPHLQHIRTIGETLSFENRQIARHVFRAKVQDAYSSQEVGTIALECPISGLYHVMEEYLIVEILKEDGEPCQPGEIGRVVITDLHNFSMPLIRYDIGDYAEASDPCPCGRGLLTIKKIHGRERNLVVMPDGTRHWPLTGFMKFRGIAPINQYQLIQESVDTIEARLVVARPLTGDEEYQLREIMQQALGFPFQLRFTYFDQQIPKQLNGKFEEFICRVKPK